MITFHDCPIPWIYTNSKPAPDYVTFYFLWENHVKIILKLTAHESGFFWLKKKFLKEDGPLLNLDENLGKNGHW